jgi:hypothetical protein
MRWEVCDCDYVFDEYGRISTTSQIYRRELLVLESEV